MWVGRACVDTIGDAGSKQGGRGRGECFLWDAAALQITEDGQRTRVVRELRAQ